MGGVNWHTTLLSRGGTDLEKITPKHQIHQTMRVKKIDFLARAYNRDTM